MLKGIDPLLGPELLDLLGRAGHGDVLALVDRNYPAYSAGPPVVRVDGTDTTRLAQAVFTVLPLDTFVDAPLLAMEPVGGAASPESHREVAAAATAAEGRAVEAVVVDRHQFYDRCRSAFGVVVTTDDRPYSCFLVTKGVV